MTTLALRLQVASYWLHAKGEGGGADFDLVMDRDGEGFPLLRGKHVTGLLRLALLRAARWDWFAPDPAVRADEVPNLLMGASDPSAPGCLAIGSARVPAGIRRSLKADAHQLAACFRRISSTAIEPLSGVAKEKHLRTVEAAIPLPLEFEIEFLAGDRHAWASGHRSSDERRAELARIAAARQRWPEWIEVALPAFDEVGAKRTRGFGRLALSRITRSDGAAA